MSSCFNPFQHAADSTLQAAPWAALARLGGDRVALLFEDLRRALGRIDSLVEALHYDEKSRRWLPRYSLAGQVILTVSVLPGILEAELQLDPKLEWRLLRTKVEAEARIVARGERSVMLRISSRRHALAVARLVRAMSKISSQPAQKRACSDRYSTGPLPGVKGIFPG